MIDIGRYCIWLAILYTAIVSIHHSATDLDVVKGSYFSGSQSNKGGELRTIQQSTNQSQLNSSSKTTASIDQVTSYEKLGKTANSDQQTIYNSTKTTTSATLDAKIDEKILYGTLNTTSSLRKKSSGDSLNATSSINQPSSDKDEETQNSSFKTTSRIDQPTHTDKKSDEETTSHKSPNKKKGETTWKINEKTISDESPNKKKEETKSMINKKRKKRKKVEELHPKPQCNISQINKEIFGKNDDARPILTDKRNSSCAVMFFGLPRSFKKYVFPSIIENVFVPNIDNHCDYFLHYHAIESEGSNRKGEAGGKVHGEDVFLLPNALRKVYRDHGYGENDVPSFSIINSTMADFYVTRKETLDKYVNTLDDDGSYLYFPTALKGWTYPVSIENIVKQWDSLEAVWNHMEETAERLNKSYERVAMLRSDVMYATPIDIYETPENGHRDNDNTRIVVPGWGKYPVNDRMVVGPHDAVQIWSKGRFRLIEKHVERNPGLGMHGESFLNITVFPAMQRAGIDGGGKGQPYELLEHPLFCFLRTRSDGSVWKDDCTKSRDGIVNNSLLNDCSLEDEILRILNKYDERNIKCTSMQADRQSESNGSISCSAGDA
eukprot:CAMPEP_0197183838 /NCGR_PEP_ID=MMETSP1423-20130617/8503_1 /TAXON_ID=476441 /ORGANISM="Pseudo-nitzschia heimii, Strain UNC1101" /LENGTH=605 /DNA_ID=CAMNT_0042634473 /DNA_START=82 /DNA_END=1899 /DNA_ORIENTATION=+